VTFATAPSITSKKDVKNMNIKAKNKFLLAKAITTRQLLTRPIKVSALGLTPVLESALAIGNTI
jgi:hypothetical protein